MRWLSAQINDQYVKKAKSMNLRSRAGFKLIEILDSYKLDYSKALDLGASPGSWSQVLAQKKKAKIYALDKQEMEKIEGVEFIKMDLTSDFPKLSELDLITSDVAPNATGDRRTDHQRLMVLCHSVLDFVEKTNALKCGGNLVMKISRGGEEKELMDIIKGLFHQAKLFKPKASRQHSSEIYAIGLGYTT